MWPSFGVDIRGIQEAQANNLRMLNAVKPEGALGAAVQRMAAQLHRYAVVITHVDTGALRASHRAHYFKDGPYARIYISPAAVNPHRQRPAVYGPYEHARGGGHAFYDRTANEAGPAALAEGRKIIALAVMYGR